MEKREVHIAGLDQLEAFVNNHLLPLSRKHDVIAFYGAMGVGKTTMINHLLKALKVPVSGSSPTFSIINEYEVGGTPIYHMDCYRIEHEHEVLDLGIEDYWDQGGLFLIEWPENIESLLPNHLKVRIQTNEDQSRSIRIDESTRTK